MNQTKVLDNIRGALKEKNFLLPILHNAHFISYIPDDSWANEHEKDFVWMIYIAHDDCHDYTHDGFIIEEDRNTVIAIHKYNGSCCVIGRELTTEEAMNIASGT